MDENSKTMTLQNYTTEELRAELKRRAAQKKAEREKIDRCRHCKHYGRIDHDGREIDDEKISYYPSSSCKFFKTKNGKYFRCHTPSQLACEHFERK